MTNKQKALIFLILGSLLSAGAGAATKIGLQDIPPISFIFFRYALCSLLIFPVFLRRNRPKLSDVFTLMPLSLLTTINVIFYVFGMRLTTATIGQLLFTGTPLIAICLGYIFYKEKITTEKSIGVIIGFIGTIIIVLLPLLEQEKKYSGNLVGNILVFCGVVAYSAYLVFSKKFQRNHSPFMLVVTFIFLTTIILLPFSVFELQSYPGWWQKLSLSGVISVIYMSVFVTILSYLANQYAIKYGDAVYAALTFYLLPIFGYFIAFLLLAEQLTAGITIGGALALFGIFLTTRK